MHPIGLFIIKCILISIDIFVTLITFAWVPALKKLVTPPKIRTEPIGNDPSHRTHVGYVNNLLSTPSKDIQTLYDLIMKSCQRCASRPCMGSREFLGWKVPKKVKHFSDKIHWRTFEDVNRELHQFGAALKKAGMVAAPDTTTLDKVKTPCRLAIFENTCAEWMIAAMGAFSQGMTVTTVYATLGMDAVVEAVIDNVIPVIVCNKKDVARLVGKMSSMRTLKTIVYVSDLVAPNDDSIEMPKPPRGVTIISFEDFVASGDVKAFPPTPPKKESTAVVMYTSGSTGKPKGVIVEHSQILACIAAAETVLPLRDGLDVYLAYLPLAHIMEMVAEFVLLSLGCTLCYSEPKSLTETGSYPQGALEVFQPTLMVAVPKIWDIMKKSVQATVAKESATKQYLVKTALEWRSFCLRIGLDTPFLNRLIFKKVKEKVGGKLTYALSGGGPLNAEVQDFVRTAFGITFVQGYGLTETTAICTVQDLDDLRPAIAGVVSPSVEMKLESTPDVCDKAGQAYLSTDRIDVDGNKIWGRGEVLVRGHNITSGYYMEPEKTKEVFEEPNDELGFGWFHTGDIGQFMEDGSLRIVDRKKNLVKLKGGEYIAVEKMEMTYGNCAFVDALEGGICCYGDGEMDRPVALMQLNKTETMKWAKENGKEGVDYATLMKSPELEEAVMAAMREEHAKSDLSHLEKLVGIVLLDSPWTPENGCLTAANKLQRRAVVQAHEKEFEDIRKKGIF